MAKKYIIGNWKGHPANEQEALVLAQAVADISYDKNVEVVICPPAMYLSSISKVLSATSYKLQATSLGTQDDLSPGTTLPSDLGAKYIILGHSSHRAKGETDEVIAEKMKAAIEAGITPILCVGEPREVREKGLDAAKDFVKSQLEMGLMGLNDPRYTLHDSRFALIAYEPVWAISINPDAKPDTPESAAEMISWIKFFLNPKSYVLNSCVLYGGSTNSKNAAGFLAQPVIDGLLVGAASLKIEEFRAIIQSASSLNPQSSILNPFSRDLRNIVIIGAEVGLMFQPIIYSLWPDIGQFLASQLEKVPSQAVIQVGVFIFFTAIAPIALKVLHFLSRFVKVLYQFGKFAAVGSANSFVDIGLLNLALLLFSITKDTTAFTIVATATALISTINSYFWNKFWTFEAGKTEEKRFMELLKFYAVTGFSSLVNGVVTTFIASSVGDSISGGLGANIGKVAGILSAFIFNFLGYKFFVFKKKEK